MKRNHYLIIFPVLPLAVRKIKAVFLFQLYCTGSYDLKCTCSIFFSFYCYFYFKIYVLSYDYVCTLKILLFHTCISYRLPQILCEIGV